MPGARSGKLYSPALVVSTVRVNPVAVLSRRTEPTGIAAPEESVTVPVKLPRNVCAHRPDAKRVTRKIRLANMQSPPKHVSDGSGSYLECFEDASFIRTCPVVNIYRVHTKF